MRSFSLSSRLPALPTLLLSLLAHTRGARVAELTRENWSARTDGTAWYLQFYQQGCKHCTRMAPMWQAVADNLETSGMRVGRVDSSAHNGIARSFGVEKFPFVLLLDSDGSVYHYSGRRQLPPLLNFARGGYKRQPPTMHAPSELMADVSPWYLILLALRKPLAMSLGLALALALCLKGGVLLLLRFLKPRKESAHKE